MLQTVKNPTDVAEYGLRYSLQEELSLQNNSNIVNNIVNQWNDTKKSFRLVNRTEMTSKSSCVRLDISVVQTSKFDWNTKDYIYTHGIKESNVFNNKPIFDIELEVMNDVALKKSPEDVKTTLSVP